MKTINSNTINKIVINKSEFITYLFKVKTVDEVNDYLSQIRKKHYDATHNCYAYIIGMNQEIQKASDDGEPSKTAGFPMLDVLKKRNMTNILAITTRYFGGIMLGAGGLIRAYSSSVSEALDKTNIYEYLNYETIMTIVSYSSYNCIENFLKSYTLFDINYTDKVCIKVGVLPLDVHEFKNQITNLTSGEAIMDSLGIETLEILIERNEA